MTHTKVAKQEIDKARNGCKSDLELTCKREAMKSGKKKEKLLG